MSTTIERDPVIWKELPSLPGHFTPRQWRFIGLSRGERCDFVVELVSRHPNVPDTYQPRAVFCHNVLYCPDWVSMRDLVPDMYSVYAIQYRHADGSWQKLPAGATETRGNVQQFRIMGEDGNVLAYHNSADRCREDIHAIQEMVIRSHRERFPDTPYNRHAALGHKMGRYSPNGVDIIEECDECKARFLHNPAIGYPVTIR